MNRLPVLAAALVTLTGGLHPRLAGTAGAADPIASGLNHPTAVAVGPDGKVYVAVADFSDKPGSWAVVRIADGKAVPVVAGLDDPKGLVAFQQWLFVADRDKLLRIDPQGRADVIVGPNDLRTDVQGKADVVAGPNAFPNPPKSLAGVVVDPESNNPLTLYVSDSGDGKGTGGAIYRVAVTPPPKKAKSEQAAAPKVAVTLVADAAKLPGLHTPTGLAMDGRTALLVADAGTGTLFRIRLADMSSEKVADGLGGAAGLAWDHYGRLFISDR